MRSSLSTICELECRLQGIIISSGICVHTFGLQTLTFAQVEANDFPWNSLSASTSTTADDNHNDNNNYDDDDDVQ
jgi:hypothetical protein